MSGVETPVKVVASQFADLYDTSLRLLAERWQRSNTDYACMTMQFVSLNVRLQLDILVKEMVYNLCQTFFLIGRDSAVGTATRHGLDGPGIKPPWGRDFPHPSRPVLGPTKLPIE
jgi:hypothetical protein